MSEPGAGKVLVSDADLIKALRADDMAAYGDLYQRHVAAAQGLGRQLVRGSAEVDDVVAEAFSKVLDLIKRGGGPEDAFRPYLLTAVRRVAHDRHRGERKSLPTGEIETFDPGQVFVDPAVAGLERSLIAQAFLSLPERWRAVLWHTEIEGAKPADVAPLLGLTANGVAALAYRAREGLRQAYLQMHLSGVARRECRPVVGKLGAFIRGGLSAREAKAIPEHLDGCRDCRAVCAELADVNVALRGVVAPVFLGPVAAAYLAAVGAKGGAAAWIAGKLLWIRHAPRQQQAAIAAGATAATAAAVTAVLVLAGHGLPARGTHHRATALPPAASRPGAPPASRRPRRPATPVTAAGMPSRAHAHPASPGRKGTRPPAPALPTPPRPASPPPAPPPPPATLTAHVDPVGALLPGGTGMVAFSVANTGSGAAAELAASIRLPPGVSYVGAGSLGMAAPAAEAAPGGWSCAASAAGAACTHGPLGPGQTTMTYLEVAISVDAAPGVPPRITVSSGGRVVTGAGGAGVAASGLAARFAADGRLDTIVAGNTLPPCYQWSFGWHPPSSSARVGLPGSVVWAGLYWSGAGYPSRPAIDLRGPGGSFQPVAAQDISSSFLDGHPVYQAYANVTSVVAAYGGGLWQAQVPAGQSDPPADTGWTLVVVAQDPSAPVGEAVVVDGAHPVDAADPSFDVPIDGLLPAGSAAGIQVATWNGSGYGGAPALASERDTLAAEPTMRLSAGQRPYLVGVVAVTTSADSTQAGPPPYDGWPGGRWDGWRVGAGGSPSSPAAACSWLAPRAGADGAAVTSVTGLDRPEPAREGSPEGSPASQDPPLPRRVEVDPCPVCEVLPGIGLGGGPAHPAPGVTDGVDQRTVPVLRPGPRLNVVTSWPRDTAWPPSAHPANRLPPSARIRMPRHSADPRRIRGTAYAVGGLEYAGGQRPRP